MTDYHYNPHAWCLEQYYDGYWDGKNNRFPETKDLPESTPYIRGWKIGNKEHIEIAPEVLNKLITLPSKRSLLKED